MKNTKLYITLALLGLLILSSCSVDDSVVTYRDVYITDYSSLEIDDEFTAYITFSDTEESIEIEANDYLHNSIIATKKNNKLVISLGSSSYNIKENETLNVYITTKSIKNFIVGGNSKLYLKNTLVENNVKIKVTGGGFFSGEINVDLLELKSHDIVDLSGSINNLNVTLYGTQFGEFGESKLSGYDLQVEDLKMTMEGGCSANLTVNKTIDIEATSYPNAPDVSTLRYKGNATIINEKLNNGSRLIKVD